MTDPNRFSPAALVALWPALIETAVAASAAIRAVYDTAFDVEHKADASPITAADRAAHRLIVDGLRTLPAPFATLPILSEEGEQPGLAERRAWAAFWLVDPLDGTREFVDRTGEFTVNIALVDGAQVRLGLVHQPIGDLGWRGGPDGAFRYGFARASADGASTSRLSATPRDEQPIRVRAHQPPRVIASRRHGLLETETLLARLGPHTTTNAGSSLKFCRVAEGAADLYLRTGPTSEWDTAAGQAVLEAAGGSVTDLDGRPLVYNQRDTLLNPYFIAGNAPAGVWARRLAAPA